MNPLTYTSIVTAQFTPDAAATIIGELTAEVRLLLDPFLSGEFELIVPWPYPVGPAGALHLPDGGLAHGAYARPVADGHDLELVVCNNGWPIEQQRCPGPLPPPMPMTNPLNLWLSAQPTPIACDDILHLLQPDVVAINEVATGRKPLALCSTGDPVQASRFAQCAEAAGLRTRQHSWSDPCCGTGTSWFVEVARAEPFAELLDLAAIAEWYAVALTDAGGPSLARTFVDRVEALADRSPADFLDGADDLILVPFEDDDPRRPHSATAGVLLGYWPPTTAALHLRHWRPDVSARRHDRCTFPTWSSIRFEFGAVDDETGWVAVP